MADQSVRDRLPLLLGGGPGRSLVGRARDGRELLDPHGATGVVRESGARDTDSAAPTATVEMRSSSGAVVASFASAMLVFSVVSMSWARARRPKVRCTSPEWSASSVNTPAPRFTLTDQDGTTYSLNEHAGHYTLLTFLDPSAGPTVHSWRPNCVRCEATFHRRQTRHRCGRG